MQAVSTAKVFKSQTFQATPPNPKSGFAVVRRRLEARGRDRNLIRPIAIYPRSLAGGHVMKQASEDTGVVAKVSSGPGCRLSHISISL